MTLFLKDEVELWIGCCQKGHVADFSGMQSEYYYCGETLTLAELST